MARVWEELGEGFRRRVYENDKDYRKQQGMKLKRGPVRAKNASDALRLRLGQRIERFVDMIPKHGSALCLGARVGGEVLAFLDHGYFAVGIDLNAGKSNNCVLYGDFHKLVFPDQSVDIVYTNSLDHVQDMDKVITEVARVLKPGGLFWTENKGGTHEPGQRGARSDGYDCMEWLSLQHLIDFIEARGFSVIYRTRWKGFTPWGIWYTKTR